MGPGYFVIAILGCADGNSGCTPVATLPTHYASSEECTLATAGALNSASDLDFPTLLAQCRPVQGPASIATVPAEQPPGARRG